MLFNYKLKIPDLYNTPIENVKKLVLNFFYKEKYVPPYENLNATHKVNSIQKNLNSTHYRIQHKKRYNQKKW